MLDQNKPMKRAKLQAAAVGGTPDDIVAKLNGALVAGLADPAVTKGISTLNAEPMRTTPAEFDKHVQAEQDRWGKVIKAANIRLN